MTEANAQNRMTVYHGTSNARGPWIFANGLQPSPPSRLNPTGAGPWVSPDRDQALMYAIRAVAHQLERDGQLLAPTIEPTLGLILTLRVDSRKLVTDPCVAEYQLPDGCSPHQIIDYDLIDVAPGIEVYPPHIRLALVRGDAAGLGIDDGGEFDSYGATGRSKPKDVLPEALAVGLQHGVSNPPGKSSIHGERHWQAVAVTGLELARQMSGADPMFVVTFAALHDVMRLGDGTDPEHGERAARLFERICAAPGLKGFPPGSDRQKEMRYALACHNTPIRRATGRNVNVGLCWDADRLNLWRLGIPPDPAYLTTPVARKSETIAYARAVAQEHYGPAGGRVQPWQSILSLAQGQDNRTLRQRMVAGGIGGPPRPARRQI